MGDFPYLRPLLRPGPAVARSAFINRFVTSRMMAPVSAMKQRSPVIEFADFLSYYVNDNYDFISRVVITFDDNMKPALKSARLAVDRLHKTTASLTSIRCWPLRSHNDRQSARRSSRRNIERSAISSCRRRERSNVLAVN